MEHPDRVGQEVDAHTKLPWLRHRLEHRHIVAGPVQAESRAEATDAATGDEDPTSHAQEASVPG